MKNQNKKVRLHPKTPIISNGWRKITNNRWHHLLFGITMQYSRLCSQSLPSSHPWPSLPFFLHFCPIPSLPLHFVSFLLPFPSFSSPHFHSLAFFHLPLTFPAPFFLSLSGPYLLSFPPRLLPFCFPLFSSLPFLFAPFHLLPFHFLFSLSFPAILFPFP